MLIAGNLRVLDRGGAGALQGAVRLEEVSLADAPSRVLASTPISLAPGMERTRFQLVLDEPPDPKGRFLITALLEGVDAQTRQAHLFGTTVAHPWHPDDTLRDMSIEVRPWN